MILAPVLFVTDIKRSLVFYTAIDPSFSVETESDGWAEIRIADGARLALHAAERLEGPPPKHIELNFNTTRPLEEVVSRLKASGITVPEGIRREDFGRFIVVKSPDRLFVQINEVH